MNLPIRVFEIMADIAEENKVKSVKWARASGLSSSRISDFKRLAKQTEAGAAESDGQHDVLRHTLSLNNFFKLWDGLRRVVGSTALRRGLIRQLEVKKATTRVRIFLRLLTFSDAQLKLVDAFTDALLHRVNTIINQDHGRKPTGWAMGLKGVSLNVPMGKGHTAFLD
jgi:hypothetical protein